MRGFRSYSVYPSRAGHTLAGKPVGTDRRKQQAVVRSEERATELLRALLEIVLHAIRTGDWKVDGACDPDADIRRAEEYLYGRRRVCPGLSRRETKGNSEGA